MTNMPSCSAMKLYSPTFDASTVPRSAATGQNARSPATMLPDERLSTSVDTVPLNATWRTPARGSRGGTCASTGPSSNTLKSKPHASAPSVALATASTSVAGSMSVSATPSDAATSSSSSSESLSSSSGSLPSSSSSSSLIWPHGTYTPLRHTPTEPSNATASWSNALPSVETTVASTAPAAPMLVVSEPPTLPSRPTMNVVAVGVAPSLTSTSSIATPSM
mmetsp:Transcript_15782/g.39083  ORF Transcript_15782/g.39083 Transcript_15782/m.39083 type:complete len:221 (-) Transcript_15782:809-1471(-)